LLNKGGKSEGGEERRREERGGDERRGERRREEMRGERNNQSDCRLEDTTALAICQNPAP